MTPRRPGSEEAAHAAVAARTATGLPYDLFEIHKDADGSKTIVEKVHEEDDGTHAEAHATGADHSH